MSCVIYFCLSFCQFSDEAIQLKRIEKLKSACESISSPHQQVFDLYKKLEKFLLIDDTHGVSVVVHPKTGSNTWRYTILNNSGTFIVNKGARMPKAHSLKTFRLVKPYAKPAAQVKPQEGLHALFESCSVLTVRHPFDRLESAFNDVVLFKNFEFLKQAILIQKGYFALKALKLPHFAFSVQFEDFLQYILTHKSGHWDSFYDISSPCHVPYW